MNRLSSRNQIIIAAVVIVAITVAVVFLGIMPLFNEATSLDEQIAGADAEINAANALLARRQSAKGRAAENQLQLMSTANQVPESPELPSLIIDLQDTANAAGLEFIQITPSTPAPAAGARFNTVDMSVILEGEWSDMIEFLRKADKLTRGIRVTSGQYAYTFIEGNDTEEAVEYIRGTLALQAYFATVAPPAPASAPATATGQ